MVFYPMTKLIRQFFFLESRDQIEIEMATSHNINFLVKCFFFILLFLSRLNKIAIKAELLQLNRTQFPSLGIFVSKKVGNLKN